MESPVKQIISSFMLLCVMTVLLGLIYPLVVMGFSQALFNHQANGSIAQRGDVNIGSYLLGQTFQSPRYFWGRLSATNPPYNAAASGGSNLSPANPKLIEALNNRIMELQKNDPANKKPIPVDLLTASASGLDPHISAAAAEYQADRVARARGMAKGIIDKMIQQHLERPLLGLGGSPYVNIIRLNLALDDYGALSHRDKR